MKNVKILSVLLLAVVLVIISSSVGAYMRKQTATVENEFAPAEVSCEVEEEFTNNQKTSITVKNTGNIEAYLRLRLVTYWVVKDQDDKTEIVAESSPILNVDYDQNNWFKVDGIYYCKLPVAPGESTPDLLAKDKGIVLKSNKKDENTTYYQVVDVFAEAIQSLPEDAVTEAWDVVVVDSDGKLSKNN